MGTVVLDFDKTISKTHVAGEVNALLRALDGTQEAREFAIRSVLDNQMLLGKAAFVDFEALVDLLISCRAWWSPLRPLGSTRSLRL